jgi:hypothetical protein
MVAAPYRPKGKIEKPSQEQKDELHNAVYGRLQTVYENQKAYAGYPNRTLTIS